MPLQRFHEGAHIFDLKLTQSSVRANYNPSRLQVQLCNEESQLENCHAIMDAIRQHMEIRDNCAFRSEDQVVGHNVIIGLLSIVVYKKLYYTHEKQIKEYNGFGNLEKGIVITGPRQGGKTNIVVTAVAVAMLCIPSVRILVVAQSKMAVDNQTGFLGGVREAMTKYFGFTTGFKYSNEGTMQVEIGGTLRKIVAVSAESGERYVYLFQSARTYIFSG